MPKSATMVPRQAKPAATAADISWSDPAQCVPLTILAILVVGISVAYGNMLALTATFWDQPLYSHGWLIPVFSVVWIYLKREPFRPVPMSERWIGLAILMAGLAMRIVGSMYYSNPVDRFSFLVVLFGTFIMVGGWSIIRWAGPALAFLIFMFPLPTILERNILLSLQKLATIASTFVFQALGFAAYREGNRIMMEDVPNGMLNVAEACSGLRMTTIFVALSVAVVLLAKRPWWDNIVILVSSIPIALLVNLIRIVATGLLLMALVGDVDYTAAADDGTQPSATAEESAERERAKMISNFIHDSAGYVMPILAMGFLGIELWFLSHLMVPDEGPKMATMGMRTKAPMPR